MGTSNVTTEIITINVASSRATVALPPAPDNFRDTSEGKSLKEAFRQSQRLNIGNTLAAALAIDESKRNNEDFSEIFSKYNNACVRVTSNSDTGTTSGSGVLFKFPKDQLILVTASHVIQPSKPPNVKIVLETNYQPKVKVNPTEVEAEKIEIGLLDPEIKTETDVDVAVLFLKECDSKKVLDKVSDFPSLSFSLEDKGDKKCMMIHYAHNTDDNKYNK